MNERLIRAIIDETVKRVEAVHRGVQIMPGTVVDGTDPTAIRVTVDGDSVAAGTDDAELHADGVFAQSLIGALAADARVMIIFYPPSGALILGTIS